MDAFNVNNVKNTNGNPAQDEAINSTEGPLLVLAGAGTGKTTVLTKRIANIVFRDKATLNEILAVTFTNKAAKEIFDRTIIELSKNDSAYASTGFFYSWIGTFHSVCLKILRENIELIEDAGYKPGFSIFAYDEQLKIVKMLTEKSSFSKQILSVISMYKETGSFQTERVGNFNVREMYSQYEKSLQQENAMDFGDIIMRCCEMLENNPTVQKHYQNKFKYILVDEYQDTNVIQSKLLSLLTNERKNICCVGDDDQCIYTWRGATIDNILNFEKQHANTRVIRIQQNYRSQANILKTAESVISNNNQRMIKSLIPQIKSGEPVRIISFDNYLDEANYISQTIKSIMTKSKIKTDASEKQGADLRQIAILVRTSSQIRPIEEAISKKQIPYTIIGEMKFYDRMEIKDSIAYIRAITYMDDNMSFERIINTPKRSIGKTLIEKIKNVSRDNFISLQRACLLLSGISDSSVNTDSKIDHAMNTREMGDRESHTQQSLFDNDGVIINNAHFHNSDIDITSAKRDSRNAYNESEKKNQNQYRANCELAEQYGISLSQLKKIQQFMIMINKFRIMLKTGVEIKKFIRNLLCESGYILMIDEQDLIEDQVKDKSKVVNTRAENIDELISNSHDIISTLNTANANANNSNKIKNQNGNSMNTVDNSIGQKLYIELNMSNAELLLEHFYFLSNNHGDSDNSIKIITIHAAKGLEFETVFLPGWEEIIIPSVKSVEDNGIVGLEEERRLAYVAITRAKYNLYISHAHERQLHGSWNNMQQSRFIDEIITASKNTSPNTAINTENVDMNITQVGQSIKLLDYSRNISQHNLRNRYNKSGDKNATGVNSNGSYKDSVGGQNQNQYNNRYIPPYSHEHKTYVANFKSEARNDNFAIGNKVEHVKFGQGLIKNMHGDVIEVHFKSGVKKIMKNFLS